MSGLKIETREELWKAIEWLQDIIDCGEDTVKGARYKKNVMDAIQEYANEHNICLFVGGVLAEKRPEVVPKKVKPRKVYIAGPMTGIPDFNRKAFNDMAGLLRSRGHIVLNPAILPDGLEQHEYMDITIAMLRCSDTVCLLEGWTGSEGAKAEAALARKLKIEIEFGYLWRMWA